MKQSDNADIDNILKDLPDNTIRLIKGSLDTKNFSKKISSRNALVKMGKAIVPVLNKLSGSENVQLRMEAAKIIELIADRSSIPVFIRLLDDPEFDIRWIAAEGLIKIGRRSIQPLMKSVRDGENSVILNEGAHHVLTTLLNEEEKKNEMSFLLSLENHHTLGIIAPMEASAVMGPINNRKN